MVRAALLSQGDEMVRGEVLDTNAAWLADQLTRVGVSVLQQATVGDDLHALTHTFQRLAATHDVLVCTGGLGPTSDDLTAQAVSQGFSAPLVFDPIALQHIADRYAQFGRSMPPANRKQAMLPEGALRLDNAHGTAPGFWLTVAPQPVQAPSHRCAVVCLPGPPSEARPMFSGAVLPALQQQHGLPQPLRMVLRTTGVGESGLQHRLGDWTAPGIQLGFHTTLGDNRIKLTPAPGHTVSAADLRAAADQVQARVGDCVFSVEGPHAMPAVSLAQVVGQALVRQGRTLALAESCTGGRVASACTAVPGASAWFIDGVVTYANAAKVARLGVDQALLDTHGAVSQQVAAAMARGALRSAGADLALSVTGIAGPGGGSAHKPVGTVWFGLAATTSAGAVPQCHTVRLQFGGDRRRIQALAAAAALDLARRHVHGLPLPHTPEPS